MERRVLGRQRRARAGALLDRRHCRDGRHAGVRGLGRLDADRASCSPSPTPRSPGCSRTSRAAPRSTARPPGCDTASSSRRCRSGATGSPGRRCSRSAARSPPATSSTPWPRCPAADCHRPMADVASPANAGENAADGVAALTPAIRSWSLLDVTLGAVHVSLGAAFFIGASCCCWPSPCSIAAFSERPGCRLSSALLVIVPMLDRRHRAVLQRQVQLGEFLARSSRWPRRTRRSLARGTSTAGRWCWAACSSPPGRPTASRPRSATRASSRIRRPTPSRPSSTPACCASWSSSLVPFTFQGYLGLTGMIAPAIVDGTGVAAAMADMVGGGASSPRLLVLLMILALILAIMTAMAGSSRTLYQGSVDGWLPATSPRQRHGAPTRAMWTDLSFNLVAARRSPPPTRPPSTSSWRSPTAATSSSTSST